MRTIITSNPDALYTHSLKNQKCLSLPPALAGWTFNLINNIIPYIKYVGGQFIITFT